MCSLAKTYVDEIVGGDGKRRYNLVRDDGSMAAQNVQIVKAYTPEQEGSTFGALDVYDLQCKEYTITLTADGWVDGQQTVSLPEIQADAGTVFVGLPADATREEAVIVSTYRIRCTARAQGSLTFAYDGTGHPSDNISLKIILAGGSNAIMNGLGGNYMPPMQELCRFTSSGTFNPADYPTIDGLYDVYIVGGGGGAYGNSLYDVGSGGGGGYAKLLKGLMLNASVPVTIGAAGISGEPSYGSGAPAVTATSGGTTRFGSYGSANGGEQAGYFSGGNGGCGGAAPGGSMGGLDGNDGTEGSLLTSGDEYADSTDGVAGKGGGTTDYCPTNPYDGKMYGIGGNTIYMYSGYNRNANLEFPALNNNAGRGGSWRQPGALPGICIIYGRPLGGIA